MKLGLSAKDVLMDGTRHEDPEVQRRCRELLPAVFEADLRARIAAFLNDKEGKGKHDLPGWERFRKMVGDDPAAKLLFTEIIRSEQGQFVAEADAQPDQAGQALLARAQELQQSLYNPQFGGPRPLAVGDVAALLFVAADPRVKVPIQAVYSLNSFFYQPTVRGSITGSNATSPMRRLLVRWMEEQSDPNAAQQMLYLAMNLELKEALGMAQKMLAEGKIKGHALGVALTTVGKLGTREQLPVLEKHLGDTTVVGNLQFNQTRITTEVRDIALGMMVHLTDQSHKDYGFAFVRNNPGLKFNPHYLGFAQPAERQAAFKKWNEYVAANKK
jgi:hypothetical protein